MRRPFDFSPAKKNPRVRLAAVRQAIEKFHSARRIGVARSGHRIDDQRRFLTLEFIDGADPRAPIAKFQRDRFNVAALQGKLPPTPGSERRAIPTAIFSGIAL